MALYGLVNHVGFRRRTEHLIYCQIERTYPIGLFESKYGSKVKVYTVPGYSREICGGPHAARTGDLGRFEIKKEEASSAGVRRIKAVLIHA